MASAGRRRRILIIVENLPVPFDRRVWQEATTLREAGYDVSVICPAAPGYESKSELVDGIQILRYRLPFEAHGILGYIIEYGWALTAQFAMALKIWMQHGIDAVHACNPPDNIFLIGAFFKLAGKKFVFDHHDINPELYIAKFGRQDAWYRILLILERLTFRVADVSIATNESYRQIAIERGRMSPSRVFVVRSGPDLRRVQPVPPDPMLKRGRKFLVGYVGVMGRQEGIDILLRVVRMITADFGRSDIQFCLVGGGTELFAMREYAANLGISDYVTFTGRVDDARLLTALSTADVCVNPDVPNEMNDKSTMNKIMEYMALGKPIVQFDLTEGRRSSMAASLYARPGDERDFALKIVELLDDPERRGHMARFGMDRVTNQLQWSHEAPKLLAAYDALFEIANDA